jgi:hypothetical protein
MLECFAMAGGAFGRLQGRRTMMVAPHTQGGLLIVKMSRHTVVRYPLLNTPENFAMREIDTLIVIRQDIDDNLVWYLFI